MSARQTRMLELIERLEATLRELREALRETPGPASPRQEAVEAFADETFRARDA